MLYLAFFLDDDKQLNN